MDAAARAAFKRRLQGLDRPVLVAALEMLALANPDVPALVENIAQHWRLLRRPRKPGEAINGPSESARR